MKKSQEVLLNLLANGLFNSNNDISGLSESDWNEIIKESCDQAVPVIAYKAALKCNLPDSVKTTWEDISDTYFGLNMLSEFDHVALHEWLSEADIPYVILKGSSSAYYYPNPLDRTMGDVDFLVAKSDLMSQPTHSVIQK